MTDQEAPKPEGFFGKVAESARLNSWKFIGAMFMEDKGGIQAVSMNKVLALATYVACMWLWLGISGGDVSPEVAAALEAAKVDVPKALQGASAVPDAMLYTLWALLGINGASKVVGVFKGNSNADTQPGA